MNKFQDALDNIVNASCPSHTICKKCSMENICNSKAKEWVDTLQELIDNYSKLEKALDKACDELKLRLNIKFSHLEEDSRRKDEKIKQLEKALDKACELTIKQRFDRDYLFIPDNVIKQKEKELKEDLLKESENSND